MVGFFFGYLNSPGGGNTFHLTSNTYCPFKSGFLGDFQIAASPRGTYPKNNRPYYVSLIMSIVKTPAEAQEEPLLRFRLKYDQESLRQHSNKIIFLFLPPSIGEHVLFCI